MFQRRRDDVTLGRLATRCGACISLCSGKRFKIHPIVQKIFSNL